MIGMHFNTDSFTVPPQISWIRFWDNQTYWRQIHLGVDVYDWTRLDYLVDELYSDKNIVFTIGGCPQWIARNPDQENAAEWIGVGSNSLPSSSGGTDDYGTAYSNGYDEWNKFIWQLATRYKGKIKAYEIWNEPQLVEFLYPWDSTMREALARMTQRAYNTIKSIDEDALVLAASVLPRTSSGGMTRGGLWWSALQDKGWPVDRVTCHIYPENGTGPEKWNEYLGDVLDAMTTYGAPSKLWITETNYNIPFGDIIDDVDGYDYVSQTLDYAGGRYVFWYTWDYSSYLGGLDISSGSGALQAMIDYEGSPPASNSGTAYLGDSKIYL